MKNSGKILTKNKHLSEKSPLCQGQSKFRKQRDRSKSTGDRWGIIDANTESLTNNSLSKPTTFQSTASNAATQTSFDHDTICLAIKSAEDPTRSRYSNDYTEDLLTPTFDISRLDKEEKLTNTIVNLVDSCNQFDLEVSKGYVIAGDNNERKKTILDDMVQINLLSVPLNTNLSSFATLSSSLNSPFNAQSNNSIFEDDRNTIKDTLGQFCLHDLPSGVVSTNAHRLNTTSKVVLYF